MDLDLASLLTPNSASLSPMDRGTLFDSLAKMLTTEPTSVEEGKAAEFCNDSAPALLPFDSPLDQSLGSPASTRDYSSSPFDDYEFDFSNVEDAIMFPNHGTQEMHGNASLAGLPLFPDYVKQEPVFSSQQLKEEVAAAPCDFSFDAMTSGAMPVAIESPVESPAPSMLSSASTESISQLAAMFVREYARSHALDDTGMLLQALQSAGIQVSNEDIAGILATSIVSPLASPAVSQHSACSHHSNAVDSTAAPVSPMQLPAAVVTAPSATRAPLAEKTRSSLQSSVKEQVIDTRYGRRFVCSVCHKQFDRAFNLRTHAMTHIDPEDRDRPFVCPWSECSKSFSRKYDAERHYRSVHQKKGEVASKKQIQLALSGRHGHDSVPSNG